MQRPRRACNSLKQTRPPPKHRSRILPPSTRPWRRRAGAPTEPMASTAPLIPLDERQRLLELRDFGILDTEPDDDYDRLVQLATVLCGTPMGTLTFVDAGRQWYKSRVGVTVSETPREKAICAHTIL